MRERGVIVGEFSGEHTGLTKRAIENCVGKQRITEGGRQNYEGEARNYRRGESKMRGGNNELPKGGIEQNKGETTIYRQGKSKIDKGIGSRNMGEAQITVGNFET